MKALENLKKLFSKDTYGKMLLNDESRYYVQMLLFPGIIWLVALLMTIVNIVTDTFPLGWYTLVFSIVCLACVLLMLQDKKHIHLCQYLFLGAVIMLLTSFLITGGTKGFSPIWICLLPSCGMFIVGLKKGTILCSVQFVLIVLILDTPIGEMLHRYPFSDAFCLRFPILYCCMFLVGLALEYVRALTNKELEEVQKRYRTLAVTDPLTGLSNRLGFNGEIEKICNGAKEKSYVALLMLDLDDFKTINDSYGHLFGDAYLSEFARLIPPLLPKDAFAARWGGDEFIIFASGNYPASFTELLCNHIITSCKDPKTIQGKEMRIKVTIGAVSAKGGRKLDSTWLLREADLQLQEAKATHKNSYLVVSR